MERFAALFRALWLVPAILVLYATSVMAGVCDLPKGGGVSVPEISPEAVGSAVVIVVAGVLILMARRSRKPANQAS